MTRSLATSDVLLLDCQSTGANPSRGQLLEIAWCRTNARHAQSGRMPVVTSHLVALPAGQRLPRRITTLTGIRAADLAGALTARDVCALLDDAIRDTTDNGHTPVVAHVARFEKAFVEDLRSTHTTDAESSLDWICTHELVCRLIPGLPHRGLKAVAGHLGHVVGEGKRAYAHVHATVAVWGELVSRLETEAGVTTFAGVREWMTQTPAVRRAGREFSVARAERLQLPEAPGVYRMLGRQGQLLYVGKATSLKRRVNSYFQKRRHAAARTLEMLTQVFDVQVTETGSALEAALLETDAIKEHSPRYNVALRSRDDGVFFCADDLSVVRSEPGAEHRLGPVPRAEALDAWVALAHALDATEPDERALQRALGLSADTPLEMDCVREGLAAFADEHRLRRGVTPLRRRLLGLGARSWKAYREALAAAPEDGAEAEPKAVGVDVEDEDSLGARWTPESPEQVSRLLEGTVRHGAHLIRRAHWLRHLCESTLQWRPAGTAADAPRRVLSISGGRVVSAEGSSRASAPAPPGHGRGALERNSSFDVATYDRLRILTTELRRIVAAGGPVELCLGPRHRLDRDALARRLFWV